MNPNRMLDRAERRLVGGFVISTYTLLYLFVLASLGISTDSLIVIIAILVSGLPFTNFVLDKMKLGTNVESIDNKISIGSFSIGRINYVAASFLVGLALIIIGHSLNFV